MLLAFLGGLAPDIGAMEPKAVLRRSQTLLEQLPLIRGTKLGKLRKPHPNGNSAPLNATS